MSRVQSIIRRYGWRTPFVVLAIGSLRLSRVGDWLFLNWLKLITKGHKGKNIGFGRDVVITPGSVLDVGDNVYIGPRCIFEITVSPPAHVTIGPNVWVSHDCHICSLDRIIIGEHVLIGEFVSIRDTAHSYADPSRPIMQQENIVGRVTIEDGVWIGRGTIILGRPEGVVIGRGAVIGANSFVSRSVPPFTVVAGVPARHIRTRSPA